MKHKKGQVLLITVMLLATVMTITLAVTFKSSTETQLTKLEEESQKALAAAEAGIEAALKNPAGGNISIGIPGFTGQATTDNTYTSPTFVSPLLQKDQQYTFYLNDFNTFNNPYTGQIAIYYDSQNVGCNNIALEITLIAESTTETTINKWISDSGNKINPSTPDEFNSTTTKNIDGQIFKCSVNPFVFNPSINPKKLLIIRSLFEQTKIGFEGSINPLPLQGKYITSEAKSSTGVTKRVRLFQSYPQIPAEFFVTSF